MNWRLLKGRGQAVGRPVNLKQGGAESIWTGETSRATTSARWLVIVAWARCCSRYLPRALRCISSALRAPCPADMDAVAQAESDLPDACQAGRSLISFLPKIWMASPDYDRGHRMYGINRWCDFFTARQLLTHVTALEELLELCLKLVLSLEMSAVALWACTSLSLSISRLTTTVASAAGHRPTEDSQHFRQAQF